MQMACWVSLEFWCFTARQGELYEISNAGISIAFPIRLLDSVQSFDLRWSGRGRDSEIAPTDDVLGFATLNPTYGPYKVELSMAFDGSFNITLPCFDLTDHGFCLIGFREVRRKLQSNLERLQRIPSVPISKICHPEMVVNRR